MCSQNASSPKPVDTTHYPQVLRAEVPLYPPIARTVHISGTIEIQVVVEKGAVVDAHVTSYEIQIADPSHRAVYDDQAKATASHLLGGPSLANVKTWQFQSEDRAVFLVKYVYRIEGEETPFPESPKVELDLPRSVTVTARPFKPTCNDCSSQ
jgi:hypothetical protein